MDSTELDRIDQIDGEAEREKALGDAKAVDARDGKPLIVMIATAFAATALVLGMLWMSNTRYDEASSRTIAEQRQ